MKQYAKILFHDVEYWYRDYPEMKLPESEEEHIIYMINQGYSSGELNYYDHKSDQEYSGWWQIKGYETQ